MKKHSYEFVKKQFEKENCKLLSKEYKNNCTKYSVECSEGHQYKVRYNDFHQGCRCPICYGNKKLTYEYIKREIEKEGYKLLENKYINIHTKLKIECPEKHQYKVRYNDFKYGIRCPICWELEKYSRSEKDCLDVVKQIIPNEVIIENDRTQIINPNTNRYLELDVYIPELNKAIEFNGEYWHDNNYSKYKDRQKEIQCKEKNIDLLTIWYQDWLDNRNEQINSLKCFIGDNNETFRKNR